MEARALTLEELIPLFEGTLDFVHQGIVSFWYGHRREQHLVGGTCKWLDRSPVGARDCFVASNETLDAAQNANVMATPERIVRYGPIDRRVEPWDHRLGPYLGHHGDRFLDKHGQLRRASGACGEEVWEALAELLLERATELYERGEWRSMVEEDL
jgi:hypothetical protein